MHQMEEVTEKNTKTGHDTWTEPGRIFSTYKSLCPSTWNVPCSRLSRLSCGECTRSGWCYYRRRIASSPSQSHPAGTAARRTSPAHLWTGSRRFPPRRSPRPRWPRCGNDPCMSERGGDGKHTGEELSNYQKLRPGKHCVQTFLVGKPDDSGPLTLTST